jgi:peptidylprolyl isomerase
MSSDRVSTPLPRPVRPAPRRGLRVGSLGAVVVLALAACGSGGDEAGPSNPELDPITVEGAFGEQPTIEFEAPFELEETQSEVLSTGDGEEVAADDTVSIDYTVASGADGSELETSFEASPISLPLVEGQTTPGLIDALVGQPVGSRVLVAVAPDAATAEANPEAAETIVFVLDLLGIVPERADGEPVDPVEGVPVVETDEAGDVTGVDVEGVEAPEELVVTPVLQGDGDEVQAGDTVTIHYTGVLAEDGTVFDSSWEGGAAATFPLTNLIQGWQQGLEGVPVGSRVVLQVPSDLGYGEAGSGETIPPDADLVFVIDVLATQRGTETQ